MRFRLSNVVRSVLLAAGFSMLIACNGGSGGGGSPSSAGGQAGSTSGSPPRIQGQPSSVVAAGQAYSFQPIASDSDGDPLTFTASNLPSWLSIDARTGRLTGTPTAADVGNYSGMTITVSDGSSRASHGPFSINVVVAGTGTATLSWMPPSTNTDGSALTNLAGFVVLYGNSPTDLTYSIAINNPSVSTYMVESLTPGTWYFTVQAVSASGSTSDFSGMASKVITS